MFTVFEKQHHCNFAKSTMIKLPRIAVVGVMALMKSKIAYIPQRSAIGFCFYQAHIKSLFIDFEVGIIQDVRKALLQLGHSVMIRAHSFRRSIMLAFLLHTNFSKTCSVLRLFLFLVVWFLEFHSFLSINFWSRVDDSGKNGGVQFCWNNSENKYSLSTKPFPTSL